VHKQFKIIVTIVIYLPTNKPLPGMIVELLVVSRQLPCVSFFFGKKATYGICILSAASQIVKDMYV